MNIRLEYSLTVDDYHERRMSYRHIQRAWLKASILMWAIILGFIVLIFINFYQNSRSPAAGRPAVVPRPSAANMATLLAVPLGGVIVWVYWCYLLRSKTVSRREFKSNPKLGDPLVMDLTDAHIAVHMQGSTVTQDWPQFKKFQETATLFLIYFHPQHALIIPKRAFTVPEEMNEFRAFAQAHVGNRPIGVTVQPPPLPPEGESAGGDANVQSGKEQT